MNLIILNHILKHLAEKHYVSVYSVMNIKDGSISFDSIQAFTQCLTTKMKIRAKKRTTFIRTKLQSISLFWPILANLTFHFSFPSAASL